MNAWRRLLTVVSLWLAMVTPARTQVCPELVRRWPYGPPFAVAASGNLAYLTSGSALLVVDIADPAAPRLVGDVALRGIGTGLAVSGRYVYVAAGRFGLVVVDVGDPSAPVEIGFVETRSEALDVAVGDGVAFVGTRGLAPFAGPALEVIDVHEPSAPTVVGVVGLPEPGWAVARAGDVVYVAAGDAGLRVINTGTPSAPAEVASVDLPGWTSDVAVSGGHLFVTGDVGGGFRVFDISLPPVPTQIGHLQGFWGAVAVSDGYGYLAAFPSGFSVIDVRSPSDPFQVGSIGMLRARGITVSGGRAFVSGSRLSTTEPDELEGLHVIDVRAPSSPTAQGFLATAGRSVGVALAAGHAWVTDGDNGLRVIRVDDPAEPVGVGSIDFTAVGNSLHTAVAGGYTYVARSLAGLSVVNARIPSSPVEVATLPSVVYAVDVAVAGSYAYVAVQDRQTPSRGPGGLRVVDVSDPTAPVELAALETGPYAMAVAVAGDVAAVVDQDTGLSLIDIVDPTSPVVVGSIDPEYSPIDVALSGSFAYLAAGFDGLHVVDLRDPGSPVEVGALDDDGSGWDVVEAVAVAGRYAYVADQHRGLRVIDVSDPTTPVEVGSHTTAGTRVSFFVSPSPIDVAVAGGLVVLAEDDAGLSIFRQCGHHQAADPLVSFVPAVAFAAGAQGAFFQTDLEINNNGMEEALVTLQWLPRGEDNSDPVESVPTALAAGQSLRYENVLVELFGLGSDSLGALRILSTSDSVVAMSRTYNVPPGGTAGTFGQGLPAIRATEMMTTAEPQRILFLSENGESRANVGCVNGRAEGLTVNIGMFDAEGTFLEAKTMRLGPYSNKQMNRVFRDYAPIDGYVDVWADGEDALFYCYGSILDNETSDPTTILPQEPLGRLTFIPAAALAAGLEGAFFQTDVELNNVSPIDLTYELLWLQRGSDNSVPVRSEPFSLAPGAAVRYANVLDEVFGLEPDQLGALAVEASGIGLLAMSRTYNVPSGNVAGTFGQELPGIPADQMIPSREKKRIIFMNENDVVRSNVGCQNGGLEPVTVEIELHGSDGGAFETTTLELPPLSNGQISRIFRDHAPVSAAYVDVWTDTDGASIYCYGSVLDNVTSDPTTVLPR